MRRIVFLKNRADGRGGLEKYTHALMRAFVEKGCQVTLLTTGAIPLLEGIETISLLSYAPSTLYELMRFDTLCRRWLKAHSYDSVFGMERTTYQTHYRAGNGVHATFLKQRTLVESPLKRLSFSYNPLHRKLLSMEKKAFESPELKVLFTNSHRVRREILETYGTLPEKIEVVHNGVEWSEWKQPFEESFQIKRATPYHFLFVGNGYKRKGLLFLLQGLHRLNHLAFTLTVIGKDKEIASFKKITLQLGLQDKVLFLGAQPNLLPFYQQADALVLPSIYDPFANVTVEALAMGLYVISSQFNGGSEVITEATGTLVEEIFSPESMAIALQKAMLHPKTETSAYKIRQSVQGLDFPNQLDKIVQKTLSTV